MAFEIIQIRGGVYMKRFISVLVASLFAATLSLHAAYAAESASAPAAAADQAKADQSKTKKPRRHWCKSTQQFQTEPCPKKARRHWCRTTQQFQTTPCPHKRKKWCISTQQFQTEPCPKAKKGAKEKSPASAPAAVEKK